MLAEDPPVPEVIYPLKYFHDFTDFIYQDSKIPAQSWRNTRAPAPAPATKYRDDVMKKYIGDFTKFTFNDDEYSD